jgi:acyl-CoA thioesterase FadM
MEVGVERIGKSSVVWRYAGYRSSDGAKAFAASVTTVAVDMDRFEAIPIPAKYRSAFERLKATT